ncbi:hypothetical protein ACIQM4_25535 [Streptomyces sp. NPDC091272]|uniref:hypothetical protein n=1 Tax=Streptomyces sp. NPDC091272 TaxID=3365981 RepID=UPI0037F7675C
MQHALVGGLIMQHITDPEDAPIAAEALEGLRAPAAHPTPRRPETLADERGTCELATGP